MHSHPPQLRPQKSNGAATHSGRAVGRGSLRSFGVAIVGGSGPRSLGAAICRPPRLASLRSARRAAPIAAPFPLLPPHLSPFSPLSLSGAPLVRRGLPRPRTPAPPYGRGCAQGVPLRGRLRPRRYRLRNDARPLSRLVCLAVEVVAAGASGFQWVGVGLRCPCARHPSTVSPVAPSAPPKAVSARGRAMPPLRSG